MIKLIAYTTSVNGSAITIRDSEGESVCSSDVNELINFLNEPYSDKSTFAIKVFFSLDESLAPIFRKLGIPACKELAGQNHTYRDLFYIPKKIFVIDRDSKSFFYDIAQYYIDDPEPEDAETIAVMAQVVMDAYHQMGLNPKKLTSPVAVYEKEVLQHMQIPNILNIPGEHEEIIEYAENCLGLPNNLHFWIQNYQIGHWNVGDIFEYDLRCYSEDTECLTIDGWKLISELENGEYILGFNSSTERCRFQRVQGITKSNYSGDMVRISNTKSDLLVTPNHRMLIRNHVRCKRSLKYKRTGTYGHEPWKIYEARNLPNGNFRLPVSYPMVDKPDFNVSDPLLQVIAWINTEGTKVRMHQCRRYYFNSINISQSLSANPSKCQQIIDTLNDSHIPYTKVIRHRAFTYDKSRTSTEMVIIIYRSAAVNIPLDEIDIHLIPMWILQNCSLRQLKLYFDILIDGDGHRVYKNDKLVKMSFFTKLKANVDRMMYLCHLLGYKVSYQEPCKNRSTYMIYIVDTGEQKAERSNSNNTDINPGLILSEYYDGLVSCPTIEDGFLVVRRNGKSCISGNSAYPFVASKLRSLQYARYAKSPCIQPEADWGYMKGIATIYDGVKVSPIFDENGEQRTGTFPAWITLHDYKWMRKWETGDFKLDTGYFIKFTAPVMPMEIPLKRLFNQRGAGGMVNNLAKRISTSVGFGKMLEKHDDGTVGDFYNPPYAAMIVSIGNLQVAEFIYKNKLQDDLVHVGVDSVAATKEVELPIRWGMGTWKLNGIGPMLVLSSGRVYHGDKKPQGMNYDQITELIEAKPKETYYTTKLRRRQTLDESIQMGDLNGLGRLKLTSSSIDLNLLRASQDRLFRKFPNNGGELLSNQYQSEPLKAKDFSTNKPK